MSNTGVLHSWNEIAAYLGRGVRTAQRWERELGLPVCRPSGKSRSTVIALKRDLEQWLRRGTQVRSESPILTVLSVGKRAKSLANMTNKIVPELKLRQAQLKAHRETLRIESRRIAVLARKLNATLNELSYEFNDLEVHVRFSDEIRSFGNEQVQAGRKRGNRSAF